MFKIQKHLNVLTKNVKRRKWTTKQIFETFVATIHLFLLSGLCCQCHHQRKYKGRSLKVLQS